MAGEPLERLNAALAGRYALAHELGSGGMATVYLADDLKHHRPVAVKVLRPELASVLGPERFLREVEIAARLNHPHILALYDSGEADGFLFYVMPYVKGESLRHRLEREQQLGHGVALLQSARDAVAATNARLTGRRARRRPGEQEQRAGQDDHGDRSQSLHLPLGCRSRVRPI